LATLRLGLRVVIGAHRSSPSLSRSVSSRSPWRSTQRGSLLGHHFGVERGEEVTRGERGIRTSENPVKGKFREHTFREGGRRSRTHADAHVPPAASKKS
jgi:hypothetical protein